MYLFAIKYARKGIQNELLTTFISDNYTEAQLYFQGFIFGEKDTQNYTLYKIGEINKELEITYKKVYICNGFQCSNDTKKEIDKCKQLKILKDECIKQKIEEQKDIIKYLFKGNEINEK